MWKVLVSLAKKIFFFQKFSNFKTFYTKKTSLERKNVFRLSRDIASGFWTKFEAQLAQPCEVLES
jgi:hypothetical protein